MIAAVVIGMGILGAVFSYYCYIRGEDAGWNKCHDDYLKALDGDSCPLCYSDVNEGKC